MARMRLLVDSDAFCKLAVSDLLSDAAALFGATLSECARLPALPYMLKRGSLPRTYGATECERCIPVAERMAAVIEPRGPWLEKLAPVPSIDPGEAILFAAAAAGRIPVISGDFRALRALKDIDGFAEALAGRIVVLEGVVLGLCRRIGVGVVRERIEAVKETDTVLRICFSWQQSRPEDGLSSYLQARRRELSPMVLWNRGEEGA